MVWFAYAMAWLSCAMVTIYGMHITNDIKCFWIMIIPLLISVKTNK